MRHILFVDDEPNILAGLERLLFPFQREWRMFFVSSGAKALELLETQHCDIVVSDMRMPRMDGAALLAEIKKRHPDTLRFVLSGQSDSETVYRSVGEAHQFLSKPCKPQVLKECIDKAFALRDLLNSDTMKKLVGQLGSLPSVPHVYRKICEQLQSPDASIAAVGQIIETDPAMTAKILQLVNSAFFGLRRQVSTATQAASLLGLDTLKALLLLTGLFSPMENKRPAAGFSIETLWKHSTIVGTSAQAICKDMAASSEILNDVYTAGLLHDAGMLLLAVNRPEEYEHIRDYAGANDLPMSDAEKLILGCCHAEIGAYLLGIWGLPDRVVEAVAYHHRPSESPGASFGALTAVHAADAFADNHQGEGTVSVRIDMGYIQHLGLQEQLTGWANICTTIGSQNTE